MSKVNVPYDEVKFYCGLCGKPCSAKHMSKVQVAGKFICKRCEKKGMGIDLFAPEVFNAVLHKRG